LNPSRALWHDRSGFGNASEKHQLMRVELLVAETLWVSLNTNLLYILMKFRDAITGTGL